MSSIFNAFSKHGIDPVSKAAGITPARDLKKIGPYADPILQPYLKKKRRPGDYLEQDENDLLGG